MAVVDINACHFVVVELSHKKINDASRHINLTMRFKFKLMMMCKKLSSGLKRGRDSKDRTPSLIHSNLDVANLNIVNFAI